MSEKRIQLAEILKTKREAQNKTIEEMSKVTLISPRELRILEEGSDFKKENAYFRLITKKYYQDLGGDYGEIAELVETIAPIEHPKNFMSADRAESASSGHMKKVRKKKRQKPRKRRKGEAMNAIVIAIFLIFIILLGFFTYWNVKNNLQATPEKETHLLSETTLEPEKVVEKIPEATVSKNATGYVLEFKNSGKNVVELKAKSDAYLEVTRPENVFSEPVTVAKGKTYKVDNTSASTNIFIGDASQIEIYVNGEKISTPKEFQGVTNLTFK